MSARAVAVAVLLSAGVAVELLSALGVLLMRNPFDRLHYLAPATTLGPLAIAAALLVGEADAQSRIKGALVAVVLLVTGPVLTHATARAARVRAKVEIDGGEDKA